MLLCTFSTDTMDFLLIRQCRWMASTDSLLFSELEWNLVSFRSYSGILTDCWESPPEELRIDD